MIYLDNAATTIPSKKALEEASIFNNTNFFNPSALYSGGLNIAKEIKKAKETLLKNIGALSHELIFTSCGSESDNMAVFCSVKRGVFVTTKGEHSAIYKSFLELKNRGVTTFFADLNADGSVNVDALLKIISENNASFVSIIHVNNETGAINDVNAIAQQIKNIDKNIIIHVDGVQAYGKIPYKISNNIDLYSISAHKINALKGTGALIKKKGVNLSPLIFGGGQENGLRSGTENVFGIKVFEYASMDKYKNLEKDYNYVKEVKDTLLSKIDKGIFEVISGENSSPYILSISAKGLRGEVLMHLLENEGIIVGNGSACSSKNRFSRVIEACGYSKDILDGVLRLSFSTDITLEQSSSIADTLNNTAIKLKGALN